MSTASLTSVPAVPTTVVIPLSKAMVWLVTATLLALGVYYFVGIEQGATAIFGSNSNVHEFVHDARHFLGFPCH
jgi:cobalt transporter subunit CbtB